MKYFAEKLGVAINGNINQNDVRLWLKQTRIKEDKIVRAIQDFVGL